jgi:hypothetical protein
MQRLQSGLQEQANASASDRGDRSPSSERAAGEAARNAAREASRDIERQRLGERMQQSADQMRATSKNTDPQGQARRDTREQEDIARALDRLAERIAAGTGPTDDQSRELTEQLARAQELRERIEGLTRELERLARSNDPAEGRSGQAPAGVGTTPGEATRLRDEYARQLQQTRELLEQLGRANPDNPKIGRGGMGLTFEGQGMVMSAPGTEPFKQDFAKWEQLRKQATLALEQAESEIGRRLQANQARDRLAAGVDDKPPAGYQQHVDAYFKALAEKKKP